MKTWRKALALLLSMLMASALLMGCGSSVGSSGAASGSPAASSSTGGSSGETITFRVSQSKSAAHPYQKGVEMFAELVKEKYGDKFVFDIYPDGQLGNNTEVLEACQLGEIDIVVTDDGQLSNLDANFSVMGLPFLFEDTDHVLRVVNGEVGQQLSDALEDKGLVIICWLENGFRYITNNRVPIHTPADLKGIKIRVPTSGLYVETFNMLGAQATPVAANELFSALQMGTVEAQENSLSNIIDQNMCEVQKYLSITRHVHTTEPIVMSTDSWNKLSADEQEAFLEIGKQVSEWSYHYTQEQEAGQLETIAASGMEINDDVDIQSFRDAVADLYTEYEGKYPELIDAIQNG